MMRFVNTINAFCSALLLMFAATTASAATFADRQDVQQFIDQMASKHRFSKTYLTKLFAGYSSSPDIISKISAPYEEKPWHHYRKLFITQKRIDGGVKFWQQYSSQLKKAESTFGVPAEIIVAILGVETFYGQQTGKYPVLQALATLAFDYPRRSAFFRDELEQYLLLTREQQLPADKLKGSYAGAMGTPQFISSSYRNFAIDFAKAGKIDLINNIPNAIGSVANYFKVHGWQSKQPIVYPARITGHLYKQLTLADKRNPKPTLSLNTLAQHGVHAVSNQTKSLSIQVALLELDAGNKKEYWLGRNNFYVITRYNHSAHYAMAVYELSQKIAAQYYRAPTSK